MNLLTIDEAVAALDAAAKAGDPSANISRAHFNKYIRPLMADWGTAQKVGQGRGGMWLISAGDMWAWKAYVQARYTLVRRGGWSQKRPWTVADFEDVRDDRVGWEDE